MGALLGGSNGAILAGLTPLLFSGFRHFAGLPMGELPQIAISMTLLLAFLSRTRPAQTPAMPPPGAITLFAIGTLIASATGLRPTGALLLLPWLWLARKESWPPLLFLLLLTPIAGLAGATAWYNYQVFGSPFRTGYQYWVAVPYEVWSLTFNYRYISHNLALAARSLFLGLIIIPRNLLPRMLEEARLVVHPTSSYHYGSLRSFFCLWGVPTILFYLCYFFFSDRFFLPIEIVCATALVPLITSQRVECSGRKTTAALAAVALLIVGIRWPTISGIEREEAVIRELLPPEGVIVSNANPLLFELAFRTSPRQIYLPLSRAVEFASKIEMTSKPTFDPSGLGPLDARAPVLLSQPGAKETFPTTAADRPLVLKEAIAANRATLLFIKDASQPPAQLIQDRKLIESLLQITGSPGDLVRGIVGFKDS
jgi:hypothetical protein